MLVVNSYLALDILSRPLSNYVHLPPKIPFIMQLALDIRATSQMSLSHDHELGRAQRIVSEGCPKTPPKSCSVVTGPQV